MHLHLLAGDVDDGIRNIIVEMAEKASWQGLITRGYYLNWPRLHPHRWPA